MKVFVKGFVVEVVEGGFVSVRIVVVICIGIVEDGIWYMGVSVLVIKVEFVIWFEVVVWMMVCYLVMVEGGNWFVVVIVEVVL